MIPLSILDNLEDSLKLATIDENWKLRVGRQTELREKFNAPDLTVRQQGPFQIINLEGHEITIGAYATDGQIEAEINRVRNVEPKETKGMSITGLQSGAFQAKLAELRKRVAGAQDQALTKIDGAVVSGEAKINEAASGVVAKVDREVADALQEFATFTNGGPE